MLCYFSGVQQSESVIHKHMPTLFLRFFSHIDHYRVWSRVPLCYIVGSYQVSILYTEMCLSSPTSQFICPPPYPLVTVSLFSASVTLLLFCELSSFVPFFWILHTSDIIWYFLSVSDVTQYDHLWVHQCCCKWHYFVLFLWLSNISLSVYTTSLSIPLSMDI